MIFEEFFRHSIFVKKRDGVALMHVLEQIFATSSLEPLHGFWRNLEGMKYSLSPTVFFFTRSIEGWIQGGAKICRGGPSFDNLLQTECQQQQSHCIRLSKFLICVFFSLLCLLDLRYIFVWWCAGAQCSPLGPLVYPSCALYRIRNTIMGSFDSISISCLFYLLVKERQ